MVERFFLRGKSSSDFHQGEHTVLRHGPDVLVELVIADFPRQDPPDHSTFVCYFRVVIIVEWCDYRQRRIASRNRGVGGSLSLALDFCNVLAKLTFQKLCRDILRQSLAKYATAISS